MGEESFVWLFYKFLRQIIFNLILDTFIRLDSVALSVVHLSPLGSQLSFGAPPGTRIESVVDWESIAKKYRLLFGGESEETGSTHTGEADNQSNTSGDGQHAASQPVGNNTSAMNQV